MLKAVPNQMIKTVLITLVALVAASISNIHAASYRWSPEQADGSTGFLEIPDSNTSIGVHAVTAPTGGWTDPIGNIYTPDASSPFLYEISADGILRELLNHWLDAGGALSVHIFGGGPGLTAVLFPTQSIGKWVPNVSVATPDAGATGVLLALGVAGLVYARQKIRA